jgi:hypothetical protein
VRGEEWDGIKLEDSQEAGARERPGLCTNLNTLSTTPRGKDLYLARIAKPRL